MGTISKTINVTGNSLMKNQDTSVEITPNELGQIRFFVKNSTEPVIAHVDNLVSTDHCVTIGNKNKDKVMLIEHFMAACAFCGIDSIDVHISNYELPILDGSSLEWVKLFRNAMLVAIAIAVGYGLYLTTAGGVNPYIMSLIGLMDVKQDMESYYEAAGGGRLFGRISSVFVHPMGYAFFLGLSFIYVFQSRQYIKKIIIALLLMAIGASAITCGVRSVLGGLVIAVAYYFLMSKNYKMMIGVIAVALVVYAIADSIPELSKYLGSMADINNKKGNVSGSSVEMRLNQLEGAIKEGSKSPLFGLGYDWTGYYQSIKGDHPVCLAFESLIYVIICNSGIFGFFLWAYMVVKYLKINRRMKLNENVLFDCLMVYYLSYSCITGEYGYMKLFLIFYVLMLCNQLQAPISKPRFQVQEYELYKVHHHLFLSFGILSSILELQDVALQEFLEDLRCYHFQDQ